MKRMIKNLTLVLVLLFLAGSAAAQQSTLDVAGKRSGRWVNGEVQPGSSPDMGQSIWNNSAVSTWWGEPEPGYINLDWGVLPVSDTGLPAHVVNGFSFSYGTNNMDPAGEDLSVYFFDNCVGWGNIGCLEGSFLFSGLPNGYGLPTLPPDTGWTWTIDTDLEDTGYEFILGGSDDPQLYRRFGLGLSFLSMPTMGATGPALGMRPLQGGNGDTGTENLFDVYYPSTAYNGTYWFGTSVWATWPAEIFAVEGGRGTLDVYGFPQLQGNANFLLSSTGLSWPSAGGPVTFFSTKFPFPLNLYPGKLLASIQSSNLYYAPYDITRLVGNFIAGTPIIMTDPWFGSWWCTYSTTVPMLPPGFTAYFQAILGDASVMMGATHGRKAEW